MHKIQSFLSTFLLFFLFVSCTDNSTATPDAPVNQNGDSANTSAIQDENSNNSDQASTNADEQLIGSWLVVNVVGEHKDLNMGLIYTWTKDGQMSMEREFIIKGPYTVNNGVIVWTTKDFEFTYDFTISGDLMTLIPRDAGHTYTLRRR